MQLTHRDLHQAWTKVANTIEEQAMETLTQKIKQVNAVLSALAIEIQNTRPMVESGTNGAKQYMATLTNKYRRLSDQLHGLEYQRDHHKTNDPNQTDAFKTDKPKK